MIRSLLTIFCCALLALPSQAIQKISFEKAYRASATFDDLLKKAKDELSVEDLTFLNEKKTSLPNKKLPRAEFKQNEIRFLIEDKTFVFTKDAANPLIVHFNGDKIDLTQASGAREVYEVFEKALKPRTTSSNWSNYFISSAHADMGMTAAIATAVGIIINFALTAWFVWESHDTRCTEIRNLANRCRNGLVAMDNFLKRQYVPAITSLSQRQRTPTDRTERMYAKRFPKYPGEIPLPQCPQQLATVQQALLRESQDTRNSDRSDELNTASESYGTLFTSFEEKKKEIIDVYGEMGTVMDNFINRNLVKFCSRDKKRLDSCMNDTGRIARVACFQRQLGPAPEPFDPSSTPAPAPNEPTPVDY